MSKSITVLEKVMKQKLYEAKSLIHANKASSLDLVQAETHLKNAKDLLYKMEDEVTNLRENPSLRSEIKQRIT